MAILIKTGPITRPHQVGSICVFTERAYRDPVFGRGEHAFVWIEGDGKGGKDSRLYAEGMVVEEPSFEDSAKKDSPVRVKVVFTSVEPARKLSYSTDIRPHRDDPSNEAIHSLAEVICRNSLKKVTSIGPPRPRF